MALKNWTGKTMLKRIAICMVSVGILMGCQSTESVRFESPEDFSRLNPSSVRSGLTAEQTKSLQRPKNGMRVQDRMPTSPSFPFPAMLDFKLKSVDHGYVGRGNMRVELPIEELGEVLAGLKEATGRSPNLDGRNALVPLSLGFDRDMRTMFSEMMGRKTRDIPHDCFMVVGRCESSVHETDQGWSYREYTTFEQEGRFYAVKRLNPSRNRGRNDTLEISVYSVDKYGLPLDINFLDLEDEMPAVRSFKRLK
jgi:hypothetical protein